MPELACRLVQELTHFPCLHQLTQVISQSPVILCFVPFFLVIMAVKAMVSPRWIPPILLGHLKYGLFFYLLQYLIDWLFEQWINHLSPRRWYLIMEISIYLIVRFPISVRVGLESFTFPHGLDKRESKRLGTLLHVTNLALNALVNSSKNFIDPFPKASNQRMATGSRLKGNTLHIRASLPEWTIIFLLK